MAMQAEPVGQSAVVVQWGTLQPAPLFMHTTVPSEVVAQPQPEGHPALAPPRQKPPVGQVRPQTPFTQGWPLGQLAVQVPLTQQLPLVQQVPPHSTVPLAVQTPPHRAVPAGQPHVQVAALRTWPPAHAATQRPPQQVVPAAQQVAPHTAPGQMQVQFGPSAWPSGQSRVQVPLHSAVPWGHSQVQVACRSTCPPVQFGTHPGVPPLVAAQ